MITNDFLVFGKFRIGEKEYKIPLELNKPSSRSKNFLLIARPGTGKTNLLMLLICGLYSSFIESRGKKGAIPIVFAPLYEFTQMGLPSNESNLPPDILPRGVDCSHYSFMFCNPPDDPNIQICSFKFSSLSVEDICSFAGVSDKPNILGYTQKILEKLKEEKPDFTIDDFLNEVKDFKVKEVMHAHYYVFTKLKNNRFFDTNLQEFNWMDAFRLGKPIIFHFGDLNSKHFYNTIAGILLQGLWDLSNKFHSAYLKRQRIAKAIKEGTETSEELTEDELFLIKYFVVALFMEEAHLILHNTKSTTLDSFPAHDLYKKMTDLLGRKKMFKYSFIVTQKVMEVYYGFRKSFDYLLLGSSVFENDKDYLTSELSILGKHVDVICNNPKYCWSITNIDDYSRNKQGSIAFFKAYLSPAGQP